MQVICKYIVFKLKMGGSLARPAPMASPPSFDSAPYLGADVRT